MKNQQNINKVLINNDSKLEDIQNQILGLHREYLHYFIEMDIQDSPFKFKFYHDFLKEMDEKDENLDCCSKVQNVQLNLAQVNLKYDDMKQIGDQLGMLPSLLNLQLYMSSNSIDDNDIYILTEGFENLRNLQILYMDFRWNKIGLEGIQSLGEQLERLKKMQ